ncbi:winged helix-turn-helix domain-containing protein [Bradyrhizobium sp. CB1650]|uniref:ATP-binding protein n=1 Tax=Bradyrhizobium sp. CB1650 TaxID=3039153 RepID=UPI0024351BDE|nr:winged helix-turn-helix domain-containing protein [Bradyrhizobium sp. CB1650]WGD50127.1 winged helix-turn-helix domain-containing protein [Bradyrhizobium sp. CB1650]
MEPASATTASIAFGRFQVSPHRRELLADGQPIKLGGRAFDVLMALIEAHGEVVGKRALMARVWPDRLVDENNLQSQIAALRAAFGAERDLIRTVSGRGYQFTGEVRVPPGSPLERAAGMAVQPAGTLPPTNLPAPVSELIGRDADVAEVVSLIGAHRLVSLTGAGGIGKTQLALAAARQILPHLTEGVWLAELSSLADPGLVPATIAAAVGLELGGDEISAERVAQALADQRLLLVLDTCEHVIGAAARMAEALLHASPAAHVIATSREPLKAEGEWIYPVPPLAVPAAEDDDFWRYGAVRLFVLRSRACGAHVSEDRHVAAFIATICRRLDGIPLAIELAAARGGALGIEALAAGLDDRFRLLTGGRRMALPRHQTLRATLDWSYELLSEPERVILRRLAIFAGFFSLDAASTVVASPELPKSEVVEGLSNLVAKSLVAAEVDGRVARYRLLDTTRAYAIEKLGESGEGERLARRHAEYYRDFVEQAEAALDAQSAVEWLDDYASQIDNLRAALDWAFSPHGDAAIGVALTAAAVPLWIYLSLLDECRSRVARALAAIEAGTNADARGEMKLHAALGGLLMYAYDLKDAVPGAGAAWTKAFEIAESLDDAEYRLTSLWGLWLFHVARSEHRMALELAERFCALAANRPDPNYRLVGDHMTAISLHYLGDLLGARRHLERALDEYVTANYTSPVLRFQFRPHVQARVLLAWILWLQGFPDQAMRVADNSVEEARGANHVLSLCYALAHACTIALWVGDLAAAESYLGMLVDQSARHPLPFWAALGRRNRGVLLIKRGDLDTGLRLLRAGDYGVGEGRVAWETITFCTVTGEALGRTGQIGDGLIMVDAAIDHCERIEERWLFAELLRVKGELLLLQGGSSAAATAEDHFRRGLDWARQQGALSWELRAATSLAQLLRDQGRPADAMALLQPVYDRFTEGFDTVDLRAAKALIDALQ